VEVKRKTLTNHNAVGLLVTIFTFISFKACKNKPADRGGDDKVSSQDQKSNQNSNPAQAPEALTPEEDIKRRIMGMAQENMSSANGPLEQALARANDGFVRAMLAKDGAEAIAARKDVWAASEEAGRMNKTREGSQIYHEISAMCNIIQANMIQAEMLIDLKKSVSSIGSYAARIAASIVHQTITAGLGIVHETIRVGAGGCIDVELKLAMVEITWLLQVAQEAAKIGDAKSASAGYVDSIKKKLVTLQAGARYREAWDVACATSNTERKRRHSLNAREKAKVAGLWRAAAQAAHEAELFSEERTANNNAEWWEVNINAEALSERG
jgi:hypothetical protein